MDELIATKARSTASVAVVQTPAQGTVVAPAKAVDKGDVRAQAADMEVAAEQLRELAAQHEVNLSFSVHNKTGRTVIRVVDADTKELVREIPPEEVLDQMATMEEIAGKLMNTKA